jgi:N-carbamoylputrescine amidase
LSLIADPFGAKVQEANQPGGAIRMHSFDADQLEHIRSALGSFRDRRSNLDGPLKVLDGHAAS